MKTILFIIGFVLAVLFSYGQNLEMRAVQHEGEKTTYQPVLQIPISDIKTQLPMYDLYQSVIENGKRVQTYTEIGQAQQESGDIWFYPENLSWIDTRGGTTKQGAFVKGSIKYIELQDVKMDIGLRKVTRIWNGEEVPENRIVSHYLVTVHFNDGTSLTLGDKVTPVNIIANNDIHVEYPGIVPGARWLMKSAIDDNAAFGTGETFSVDGGLKIDYD